jgi:hyperosmotically inducible periplasmic protein
MQLDASRRRVFRIMLAASGLLASATALAFGIGAVLDRPATLMSPIDYRAAKASIEDKSHYALDKCLLLDGSVFDVCRAEAQADERTHRAALEARYLGTVDAADSARQVEAEADYDVAVARCDGREGKARLECLKGARAEKAKQLSQPLLPSRVAS